MKKTIITAALFTLSWSIGYSGTMGPISSTIQPHSTPFISLETAYTWNRLNDVTINGYAPLLTRQNWGGRLAAGIIRPYTERFSFSSEFGGGYYGSSNINLDPVGVNINRSLDGYDFLVGGVYNLSNLGLFGNIGVMAQTMRFTRTANLATQIPGGLYSGTAKTNSSKTQMLPEIKIGAIYNVYQNLDLSLAYMYVFGSNSTSASVYQTGTDTSIVQNSSQNMQNPSLSSLMLGLRYNFT